MRVEAFARVRLLPPLEAFGQLSFGEKLPYWAPGEEGLEGEGGECANPVL